MNFLRKIAQDNFKEVKNIFAAGVSNLIEEIEHANPRTGTHKELKSIFQQMVHNPELSEVVPSNIKFIYNEVKDLFQKVNMSSSYNELKSLYFNDLHYLVTRCIGFSDDSDKETIMRSLISDPKNGKEVFTAYTQADAIAHDMIIWFASDVEDLIQRLAKLFNTKYPDRLTDKFKDTRPGAKDALGVAKFPISEYQGFIRKYGPKIGLGVDGSSDIGNTEKGINQLGLLYNSNRDLFARVRDFIVNVIHKGIKTNDKLVSVKEIAKSLNSDLLREDFGSPSLKASPAIGEFTFTVSDLDLRNENMADQDKIFFKELKDIISKSKLLDLSFIITKSKEISDILLKTDNLSDDNKKKFIRELAFLTEEINRAIPVLNKKEKAAQKLKAISEEDFKKAILPVRKSRVEFSDKFKNLFDKIYTEIFGSIMGDLQENMQELESIANTMRKELGLIK